jgi:hypothetical protein
MPYSEWEHVEITDRDGRIVSGSYRTGRGLVTVRTSRGRKSTPIGNLPAIVTAQMLLRELADEREA